MVLICNIVRDGVANSFPAFPGWLSANSDPNTAICFFLSTFLNFPRAKHFETFNSSVQFSHDSWPLDPATVALLVAYNCKQNLLTPSVVAHEMLPRIDWNCRAQFVSVWPGLYLRQKHFFCFSALFRAFPSGKLTRFQKEGSIFVSGDWE